MFRQIKKAPATTGAFSFRQCCERGESAAGAYCESDGSGVGAGTGAGMPIGGGIGLAEEGAAIGAGVDEGGIELGGIEDDGIEF